MYQVLAGHSYATASMSFVFVPSRKPVPFNKDTIDAIYQTWVDFVDTDGKQHKVNEDGGAQVRVTHVEHGPIVPLQKEKQGERTEVRVDVSYPKGSDREVAAALTALGKKHGFLVEPAKHSYEPGVRKAASQGDTSMSMPKFAAEEAEATLSSLDTSAREIQANYKTWGMPFEAAKRLVNALDKAADSIEIAAFGEESFKLRQVREVTATTVAARPKTAEVIKQDGDEPYMKSFANPMAPVQVEGDEPYMAAYKDDQSSAVHHGKSTTGRPLAP